MQMTVSRSDLSVVVSVEGRLDSATAPDFERELLTLIAQGESRLVLDFSRLLFVTSAGLRIVLRAAKRLANAEGDLVLCALNETVTDVFELAGFLPILTIRSSVTEALRHFEDR